ncbi:MAG: CPBP family intramembrane metalloprotease [Chitinophagaceae bacterium]
MTTTTISTKVRVFEIIAVILTALGKFVFMDYLNWRLLFIATAILFWSGYVLYRSKKNVGIKKYWGFRTDNFKKVMLMLLPFGLISIVAFIGIGFYQKTINITWHIIPVLILYPIWGIIQQYLLIALTAGNLRDLKNKPFNKGTIIFLSATLFGLIHYPFAWLIIGTFILALLYGTVYLKEKNIYVLGIFHGWLGGLFFYTVVDRDPFIETFGRLLHITK